MKMDDFTKKWETFQAHKGYLQRIDELHPMDLFIGIDAEGNDEIVLFTVNEPIKLKSSKELRVEKKPRKTDGKWATQISSLNEDNREIFARLCIDLVDSSFDVKDEQEGLLRITNRFLAWQRLFAAMKTTLPNSVIKGMIGELIFAREQLVSRYGWEQTMEAWQGPDAADRDYVIGNIWFEIKAISTGKNIVTISSLNQLEIDNDGFLVINYIDESSSADGNAFNVTGFINSFRESLKNEPVALQKFEQKLISIGYLNKPEYDDLYFKSNGIDFYKVDDKFPKIVSKTVPQGIVGVRYDIDIASISEWKVDDEQLWK